MIKKSIFRISPFVVLAVLLLLFEVLFSHNPSGEGIRILMLRPFLLVGLLVLSDIVLKRVISKNKWLWTIELGMCLALLYYWVVS